MKHFIIYPFIMKLTGKLTVLFLGILFFTHITLRASDLSADTVKILWVGSSSTYCHDLPLQSARALEGYFAPRPVMAYMVGRSGTGFHEYLQPDFEAQYGLKKGQTLLEKIKDEEYDYVVLQMITYFIGDHLKKETEESTDILVKAIRESGAEPVYYEMGWRQGPENEVGRQLIAKSAQKNKIAYYAPCSSAWKQVRAEKSDLELHNLPDSDHPGTLGTYLNISCIYTAIAGEKMPAKSLNLEIWPRFGAFDKEAAAEKLTRTSLDDYHADMPGWMQKISVMRTGASIDKKIAKYLNQVAFENWKTIKSNHNLP